MVCILLITLLLQTSCAFRLLDICHGETFEKEHQLVLYLVFEHVDQDLATYIERCPPPGLGAARIKVTSEARSRLFLLHLWVCF